MRFNSKMFVALALCAIVLGAQVQAARAAAGGSLSSMAFMLGTWLCTSKALDGSTIHTTLVTRLSNDGTRMVTRDTQGAGTTTMWWDVAKKQWIQTTATSKGSGVQTSPGWTGNSLVFVGTQEVNGIPVGFRNTTTKVSDTQMQATDELSPPSTGQWVTVDTTVCAKAH
jgi:hypothetical protein